LPALIAFSLLLLLGCKTTSAVGSRMILPPGAQIMDVPEDQVFLMASPVSQPMPVFPPDAPRSMAINACVEIVIDASGAVSSATPLYAAPDCPLDEESVDPRFVSAVTTAVAQWQFLAAALCTFPDGTVINDDCSGDDVLITPIAIKLSYVFSFKSGRVTAVAKRA
jgi:hypothetical protein